MKSLYLGKQNLFYRCFIVLAFLFLSLGLTSTSRADEFSPVSHDLYFGDINSDGYEDIYLKAKDRIIILAGDINIPITIPPLVSSLLIESNTSGALSYNAPLVDETVDVSSLTLDNSRFLLGNFNGDGYDDVFIKVTAGGIESFTLAGSVLGQTPVILQQNIDTAAGMDLSGASISVTDLNGDGKDDLQIAQSGPDLGLLADSSGQLVTQIVVPEPGAGDVGATAGQFRVDESGSATYSIPIATVAGTADVAPQISLNYSSQGGNGIAGKGWNLGGLSAITRCRQTLHQDSSAKAITWNSDDRFCLDGQRLIKTSGTYGSPGSIYKTEIDSFSKITAHGGSAGNPAYFTVERKDGSESTYGNTADSDLTAGNGKTLTWALNKFEDSVGNQITYSYHDDSDGQRIDKIYYAYASSTTGTTTTYLDFDYEPRPDDTTGYVAGYAFSSKKRLKSIKNVNGGTELRKYTLAYKTTPSGSTANKTSKLASIQECRGSTCLPATTFDWAADSVGIASGSSGSFNLSPKDDRGVFSYQPADINGDGNMDLVWLEWDVDGTDTDHHMKYAISDGSKLTQGSFTNGSSVISYGEDVNSEIVKLDLIDYNGDGRMDVIVYNQRAGIWKVHLSTPQADGSWKLSSSPINMPSSFKTQASFADVDSDGLSDVVYVEPLGTKIYKRELVQDTSQGISSSAFYKFGSAVELSRPWPTDDFFGNPKSPFAITIDDVGKADFNGDGVVDIVVRYHYSYGSFGTLTKSYPLVRNGNSYEIYGGALGDSDFLSKKAGLSDFNNDGLTDIYYWYYDSIQSQYVWTYKLNTGVGFEAGITISSLSDTDSVQIVDYNQDSHPDIIWHDESAAQLKARLWSPEATGFNSAINILSTSGSDQEAHLFLDMNGDGVTDYVNLKSDKLYTYAGSGANQPRSVITKITNGLGAETDITYGSLTDDANYDRIDVKTQTQCQTVYYGYQYCTTSAPAFYSMLNSGWSDLPASSHIWDKIGSSNLKKHPVLELNAPIYVVTQASSSAPVAGNANAKSSISYHYGEAKLQAAGRGFLGFHQISSTDNQTGVKTTTTYRQDFPFIGYPSKTEVRNSAGDLLSQAENTWALQGRTETNANTAVAPFRPYIAKSVEQTYSTSTNTGVADKLIVSGSVLQTVTTDNSYDAYGNPLTINVTTTGGGETFTKNTTNVYGSSTYEQEKGRLSRTTVVSTRNGQSETRVSAFNYYTAADGDLEGLLKDEIIEPDNPTYTLTTTYLYDAFGNKIKATQSGQGVSDRFTEWVYDEEGLSASQGRYLKQTKNVYGQITEQVIERNEYGAPSEVQNIDGVQTDITYDTLGREYFRISDTGAWSQTQNTWCSASGAGCPSGAQYKVTTLQAGGGEAVDYFDRLGRSVRKSSRSFNGSWVYQDTEYDNLGRVKRVSQPYFVGNTRYWTTNTYDLLGRVIQTRTPDSAAPDGYNDSFIDYSGLTTTYTNDKSQTKTETKNVLGELVEVVDDKDGKINYSYDPQGNLEDMIATGSTSSSGLADGAPSTITTSLDYDLLGRKISMNDPDKGVWKYNYNVFGELTAQLDAKNQCSVITYDLLGRQLTRQDRTVGSETGGVITCNGGILEGDTSWTYNNATSPSTNNGLGQLQRVEDSISSYEKEFTYDSLGRADETLTHLGPNSVDGQYYERVTYDQYGRVHRNLDGELSGSGNSDKGFEYQYNAYGYLSKVVDAFDVTSMPYSEVLAMDARGNVVQEKLRNGYTTTRTYDPETGRQTNMIATLGASIHTLVDVDSDWDVLGNLTSRSKKRYDNSNSLTTDQTESFGYDSLNRLTSTSVAGGESTTITYDAYGNIKTKTGVGTYSYAGIHGGSGGPHAVTGIDDGSGNVDYTYDANGNLISNTMADGESRTIDYTTFDKPKKIEKGNHRTEFEYGPDRARYKRIDTNTINGEVTTTFYIGSIEKIIKSNGEMKWKRYLSGMAIITDHYLYDATPGVEAYVYQETKEQYLYKDHLGSILVITEQGDGIGAVPVAQDLDFDAWGKRRDAMDWSSLSLSALYGFAHNNTTRGFTGHEMLDEVGLIHMNGRIYDPHIGRFAQADPFVQAPSDTQMLNRYSYVRNNPLNATDPSGYFFVTAAGLLGSGFFATAASVVIDFAITQAIYRALPAEIHQFLNIAVTAFAASVCGPCAIPIAGATSFHSAYAQTGDLEAAFKAGAISTATAATFYAVGQGLQSAYGVDGGGVLGTGLDRTGYALKVVSHGLIGGVSSVLQGGKFGHGFAAAGVSAAATGAYRVAGGGGPTAEGTILSAIVGGTASEISGGKFANGAVSGAFGYVLNASLSKPAQRNRNKVNWKKFESEMKRLSLMSSENVFKEAGFTDKQIQEFELANACSTRVSIALTNAGAPITSGGFNPAGTRVITSVHRMENYLTKTFGSADSTWGGGSGVAGQVGSTGRGIVMYRDPSGGAGLNHVTAWSSGGKVAVDGWFSTAPKGTTASYWSF